MPYLSLKLLVSNYILMFVIFKCYSAVTELYKYLLNTYYIPYYLLQFTVP